MLDFMLRRLLLSVGLFLLTAPLYLSQTNLEFDVKAAFLYNFAKFTEWPARAFARSDSPFTFCLVGDPFGGGMEKAVQSETFNGRPVVVRRVSRGDDVLACHILYVSEPESGKASEIIEMIAMAPVLTVGETEDFIKSGGMIRFTENGQRVRFEINPDAAEKASLHLSSKLLRLADIVRVQQRGARR